MEASLIMPIVLLVLALLVISSWKAHDIIFENMTANEAVELYGHMQQKDEAMIEELGRDRLSHTLTQNRTELYIGRYLDGSRAVLRTLKGERRLTDSGFRPEKIMRAITLTEAINTQ